MSAGDAESRSRNGAECERTGTPLFVINLCASMAPVPNVGKSLPGLETYRLYQVARREDGRTRYRLRLGFFTNEADAETVLTTVRNRTRLHSRPACAMKIESSRGASCPIRRSPRPSGAKRRP